MSRKSVVQALFVLAAIFTIIAGSLAIYQSFKPPSPIPPTPSITPTPFGKGATSAPTQAIPTAIPTQNPTPTLASTLDYSAAQPGPGCDTGKGTWTPQGVIDIMCGTQLTPTSVGIWGYLYLQLPSNAPFSADNKITVTSSLNGGNTYYNSCLGLAEQGVNTGYLADYCAYGTWSIVPISNQGIPMQPLSSNSTSMRTTTTISLALKGNTLTFIIDTETHQITITPIQPIKVAIAYYNPTCGNCSIMTDNFSYITPAS